MKEESQENFVQKLGINGEREIPGRQKVVYGSNVPVLTLHASQNHPFVHCTQPCGFVCQRQKPLGYEREARVIKNKY